MLQLNNTFISTLIVVIFHSQKMESFMFKEIHKAAIEKQKKEAFKNVVLKIIGVCIFNNSISLLSPFDFCVLEIY